MRLKHLRSFSSTSRGHLAGPDQIREPRGEATHISLRTTFRHGRARHDLADRGKDRRRMTRPRSSSPRARAAAAATPLEEEDEQAAD
eukprot:981810-Pyramimonas_sp.AAC.1